MKEKKVSKFSWVFSFIIFSYLVFLGVFLIWYQVRVHKLERQVTSLETYINKELYYELDDLFGEVGDAFDEVDEDFELIEKDIDELKNQQEHYAELIEDYYKLVAEKAILQDRLAQAKEDAKGIYTEEDIRYAIDIFATYLVEYPPNGSICVYENETLFVFKMVDDKLVLNEMLNYNDLKELWFNK